MIPKLYHNQSETEWNLNNKLSNWVINRKHLETTSPFADYVIYEHTIYFETCCGVFNYLSLAVFNFLVEGFIFNRLYTL